MTNIEHLVPERNGSARLLLVDKRTNNILAGTISGVHAIGYGFWGNFLVCRKHHRKILLQPVTSYDVEADWAGKEKLMGCPFCKGGQLYGRYHVARSNKRLEEIMDFLEGKTAGLHSGFDYWFSYFLTISVDNERLPYEENRVRLIEIEKWDNKYNPGLHNKLDALRNHLNEKLYSWYRRTGNDAFLNLLGDTWKLPWDCLEELYEHWVVSYDIR